MGASIAFHLAEAGVRDVLLLERGDLGRRVHDRVRRRRTGAVLRRGQRRAGRAQPGGVRAVRAPSRAARSTCTRSATCSSTPSRTRGRRPREAVALQQSLGVGPGCSTADEAARWPRRGDRRRAGRDLPPARRLLHARGRRPGLRARCPGPRCDGADRRRGHRHRGARRRGARRSRPRRAGAPPRRGLRRRRVVATGGGAGRRGRPARGAAAPSDPGDRAARRSAASALPRRPCR